LNDYRWVAITFEVNYRRLRICLKAMGLRSPDLTTGFQQLQDNKQRLHSLEEELGV
jgi:hypothetical protein